MRRFLTSGWCSLLTTLVLAGVTVGAFAMFGPTGEDVGNAQMVSVFKMAGWALGPVMGLLSLLVIGLLNVLRRIVRLRKIAVLDPVILLCGTVPWFVFGWVLADEPRYTAFGRAVIDFAARPILWGGVVSTVFVLLLSISLLFPVRK